MSHLCRLYRQKQKGRFTEEVAGSRLKARLIRLRSDGKDNPIVKLDAIGMKPTQIALLVLSSLVAFLLPLALKVALPLLEGAKPTAAVRVEAPRNLPAKSRRPAPPAEQLRQQPPAYSQPTHGGATPASQSYRANLAPRQQYHGNPSASPRKYPTDPRGPQSQYHNHPSQHRTDVQLTSFQQELQQHASHGGHQPARMADAKEHIAFQPPLTRIILTTFSILLVCFLFLKLGMTNSSGKTYDERELSVCDSLALSREVGVKLIRIGEERIVVGHDRQGMRSMVLLPARFDKVLEKKQRRNINGAVEIAGDLRMALANPEDRGWDLSHQ